ncbi:hypothetical protein CBS101457_004707 [Exobasidium rhododendri]|nr:hypothetical protein CBS101457_004707 [Exobasidium rhododendri]
MTSLLNGLRRHSIPFQVIGRRSFTKTPLSCLPITLSSQWMPTLRSDALSDEHLDSVKLLLQGGYIRQSSSGFYTFLPLGLRVLRKIETLVDEEMEKIGACKLELPTLLSSSLWHKSGRVEAMGSELYRLKDRKGSEYILAPTFEEEITKLVGDEIHSWRNLPVKVYQTTRKYRDEPRPRNGLLRTREFLMKDLYTFDADLAGAKQSYRQVRSAYDSIMTKLFGMQGKGWKLAEADTGAMGGAQSHEYQVPDDVGEDELFFCSDCSYTANKELATSISPSSAAMPMDSEDLSVSLYGSDDVLEHSCSLTAVVISKQGKLSEVKLAHHLPTDNLKATTDHAPWDWKDRPEGPMIRFDKLNILMDKDCIAVEIDDISQAILRAIEAFSSPNSTSQTSASKSSHEAPTLHDYFQQSTSTLLFPTPNSIATKVLDLRQAQIGDQCSSCRLGSLGRIKSIEVGHTFLLGTRYSKALEFSFTSHDGKSNEPFQMGCYGIGITRIMGVLAQIASKRYDSFKTATVRARQGFVWDRIVAPYTALIIPLLSDENTRRASEIVSQALQRPDVLPGWDAIGDRDIAVDDRSKLSMGVRMADADLLGCPLIFLLGENLRKTGKVEVRSRTQAGIETTFIPLSHFEQHVL